MAHGRQRRRSWRRHVFRLTALLLIGIVIGAAVALSNFDKDMFDRLVADRIEDALGRRLDIDGELAVSLSLEPEITATNVRLGNPGWADGDNVLAISRLDAKIALLPLFIGKLTMLHLSMDQVDADLEVAAGGEANWNLETSETGTSEGGSVELDLPDELTIQRLNFTFVNHDSGNTLNGYFDAVHIASSSDALAISTSGEVKDTPVTVDLDLPSLDAIIDPDLTTPVKGKVSALGLNLAIDGSVGLSDSGDPTGTAKVTIDGDDISSLSSLAGFALPSKPFSFDGTAEVTDDIIKAQGTAVVADTSLTIDAQLDTSSKPLAISGTTSISGKNPAWIAELATISLPTEAYTIDMSFNLDQKLQVQGKAAFGDLKADFDVTDASWDGIPPDSVTLKLDGPDLSKLGDWLDIGLPAVPFELSMTGNESGSTYVIKDALVTSNDTKVGFNATLSDFSDPLSQPLDLDFTTDNLANVGNLYELDLTAMPFQVSTKLVVDGDTYKLGSLAFTAGQQHVTGSLTIDDTNDRTAFSGNLATDELDVATIVDSVNDADVVEDEPLLIPDPGVDLDVSLTASTVTLGDARFDNADLRLRTDDKHVGIYGLTAVFAGGQLTSDFTIAHGVKDPPIDGTLKLANASTTHISTMFDLPGDVRGPLNIDIEADSDIADETQTLKDVTGHADLVLQNGYVGSDVLRQADSFVNLLAPWRNKKDPSEINCLVLRYDLGDGRATSEVTLLDTTTMTVAGTGYVDMLDETFHLRLAPTPKDTNLISMATAVKISGPIDDPSLSVGPLDLAAGAAGGLVGTLLAPIKALMPVLGLDGDDNVCQAALDPDRGAANQAKPGVSACARPKPWTDNGQQRFGRHRQQGLMC